MHGVFATSPSGRPSWMASRVTAVARSSLGPSRAPGGFPARLIGNRTDEAYVQMVAVIAHVANNPLSMADPAGILEPLRKLSSRGASRASVLVESLLQSIVDKNRLGLAALEPMSKQCPLRLHVDIRGPRALQRTPSGSIAALAKIRDIRVPTALMASMVAQSSAASSAEVMHTNSRCPRMLSAYRIERLGEPGNRFCGAVGAMRIADHVTGMSGEPLSVDQPPALRASHRLGMTWRDP